MRIETITANDDFTLAIHTEDGREGLFDVKPYFQYPIFKELENIVEFKKDKDGGFKMTTEVDGNDGNDNKKAVLRHTYLLQSNTFSMALAMGFANTSISAK